MKDGFTSAATITALPLSTFVARVQAHGISEKDAMAIYDHAASAYETRVITSYEAVHGTGLAAIDGSISTRERVQMVKETGETLVDFGIERLFENMDRDLCDDCGSFTSPAAYFVEILQFLRTNNLDNELKHSGQEHIYGTALQCLLARRPDLKKLELTCTNTKTVIPYLDLVNEIMESFVVYLWDHSHPKFNLTSKEGTETNDHAYSILSEAMCPFNKLPYHQPLDEIRTFLKHIGTSRYELLDICRRAFHAGTIVEKDKEIASTKELYTAAQGRAVTAEYLSLTESEYICLTGEDYLSNKYNPIEDDGSDSNEESGAPIRVQAWWQLWGYKKKSKALQVETGPEVISTEFLRRTGLKSSDLVELLSTEFVNPHIIVLDNPHMSDGWHVGHARLVHLNGGRLNPTELMRIQQFVRLQAKLGWKIKDLDMAISVLSRPERGFETLQSDNSINSPMITTNLLDQLVSLSKLIGMTGLDLPRLLTFYGNIDTRGETSLFAQLFLTHNLTFTHPVFKPDEKGGYFEEPEKIESHKTFTMASLGLSNDDFDRLIAQTSTSENALTLESPISIQHLSFFYRWKLMAQVLHVDQNTLVSAYCCFGESFFSNPSQTLHFLVQWKRMVNVGITFEHLQYVIDDKQDPLNPVGLSEAKILGVIKLILEGIDVIQTTHPNIKEEEHDALTKEHITAKLSLLYDNSQVEEIHQFLCVVLLPQYAEERLAPILVQLSKIALIVKNCRLSTDEVKFMAQYPHDVPILQHGRLTSESWIQLSNYLELRNGLPNAPSQELIHLFRWASNPDDEPGDRTLMERLSSLMQAKQSTVTRLLAQFSSNNRELFKGWSHFLELKKACDLSQRVKIDVDRLFLWAERLGDYEQVRKLAHDIQWTIKACYTAKDWEEVVKPLRHQLRSSQRDALVEYLLNQPEIIKWRIYDVNSLFAFFLIDPQMGPCLDTSRIKQAISTAQLFVQRCLYGQEEGFCVPVRTLDRRRWEWIKSYHTWETNRKIFVYPENWIEPSLRDDKSPIFQAFETDIIQSDMDPRSIQDAVKRYLSRLDEVSNLHVVSICSDKETNIVHIFARTRGAPFFYYYRSYNTMEAMWMPWEKMQLDIPYYEDNDTNSANHGGTFLKPVIWMGRLIVFIPRFVKQVGYGGTLSGLDDYLMANTSQKPTNYECWELKVGWTEYQNGKWTATQTTSKAFRTQSGPGGVGTLRECVFTTTFCNDDLYLTTQIEERRTAWFRLSKGQFDSVETTDLLSQEFATASPLLTSSKPGIHREFGTIVDKDIVCVSTEDPSISNVHLCPNNMHQCSKSTQPCIHLVDRPPTTIQYDRRNPTSAVFSAPPDYQTPFYHEFSGQILRYTNTSNTLDDLYAGFSSEVTKCKHNALGHSGAPPGLDICMTYPNYHELKSPYALYNWEFGLHIPMLLMEKLRSCHQYEQALKIAHNVFDPMSHHLEEHGNDYCTKNDGGHSEIDYPKRSCVWKWTPFKELSAQNVLGRLLNSLKANSPGKAGGQGQIHGLRDAPLHPHVIARSRPVAYMKWFVMSYINILLDSGDQYFRQNTSESVSQAFQYYTLAAHLSGPQLKKPQKRGKVPGTYDSLIRKSRIEREASVVNCQTTFPFAHHTSTIQTIDIITAPALPDADASLYFCVPENDKLRSLHSKIDDRLYKIRHCQDIRGLSMCRFDLLEPQVDTLALVQATNQGLSIQSILQDLNTPMPNYRFRYILEKAFEMVQELKSLGNAFLEAMTRKDSETYNLIRAGHATSINAMILDMKKLNLQEANKALVSLQEARKGPLCQLEHLCRLLGENEKRCPKEEEQFLEFTAPIVGINQRSAYKLTPFEAAEIEKAEESTEYIEKRNIAETASALLLGHPVISTSAMKIQQVMGQQVRLDSLNLGEAASAYARAMTAQMELVQSQSMGAARKSSLLRQYQDRIHQANSLGYEIKHIDSQIEEQKIRIKLTNRDIEMQQKQLEFMARSEQFLRTKYTNQDLCIWREKQLRDLYHQTYVLTYDLAKKAESLFQFERGPVNSFDFEHGRGPSITNFIQGTWDTNKDGLFSGEQLYLGLKRLEMAYNENRGYDYEITKHISLRQLYPKAFLELRELGNCEFDIPEALFDIDFPGHYKRRIKTVSLTFHPQPKQPPGASMLSVNCTMRLIKHSYRAKIPTDRDSYAKGIAGDKESFYTDDIPIDNIATSSGLNDGGVAKTASSLDDRYLPFEGAGVISRWRLELPPHFRAFDYRKVPDATVHVRYTSVYGGTTLKRIAGEYVDWYLGGIRATKGGAFALFDIRADFATEWKTFLDTYSMSMASLENTLPFFANRYSNKVAVKEIHIFTTSNITDAARWKINVTAGATSKDVTFTGPTGRGGLKCFSSGEIDCTFGNWSLALTKSEKNDGIREIWVVVHYTVQIRR
ncbi:hypothetical protein DFP73DRAFT_612976 [Morchella snyderi]|nr:hypothetical protein DFP73DRAFT_612976 [Morchella snyderi]